MKIGIFYDTSEKGLGGHGTHCAFRGLPGIERIALADSNQENLQKRMTEAGASVHYNDYITMLDSEKPDILVLGSRLPGDHMAPFEEAVRRGIHILSEKPLCAALEDADRMASLAEKYQVKVAVAHLARYALLFRKMKEMIENGAIGKVLSVYGRGKEDERGGGEDMLVLGTHILDTMNWLFGMPESLFAEVTVNGAPLKKGDRSVTREPVGIAAGDNIFAHLHYPNAVRGFFESRKGLYKGDGTVRMGITVVGTEGTLSMRYTDEKKERQLRLTRSSQPPEDEAEYEVIPLEETRTIPGAEPLVMGNSPYFSVNNRFAAWDLMQAIRENRETLANIQSVQNVLQIIQGIYLSQLTGQRISLPLKQRRHPLIPEDEILEIP